MPIQKYKKLNQRFTAILIAIVEGYINRCIPISSTFVQKKIDTALSTASIRNVMSLLEKDGFLKQIHKSGGRVPTDLGYRFYINTIKANKFYSAKNISNLEDELKTISNNVDELFNATASMIAAEKELNLRARVAQRKVEMAKNFATTHPGPGTHHDWINIPFHSVGEQMYSETEAYNAQNKTKTH